MNRNSDSDINHVQGIQSHLYHFDWSDLAFSSKKPLRELNAVFIAAPRKLSQTRLAQLIKEQLPKGNVILGIAKEAYVSGLEGQPSFRMLELGDLIALKAKVNAASPRHKLYTLSYFQRETQYIFEKLSFRHVLLVRGSWHMTFHTSPAYYALVKQRTPYTYISPFASDAEALTYANTHDATCAADEQPAGTYSSTAMLDIAQWAATRSLDYTFQTGVALGKKSGNSYKLLGWSYNRVVPYQTHAMHTGNTREDNYSPPNDLNHYDAIHAEMNMLIAAARENISLMNTTLFINLLPCPTCARNLSQTDISTIVYRHEHSAGYAVQLLSSAGKKLVLSG